MATTVFLQRPSLFSFSSVTHSSRPLTKLFDSSTAAIVPFSNRRHFRVVSNSVSISALPTVRGNSSSSVGSINEVRRFYGAHFCLGKSNVDIYIYIGFSLFQLIECLINRVDLTESEAEASLEFLLSEANEALISAFLVLLRAKGETFEEVSSFLLPPPPFK